jgi:integrase
MQRRDVMPPVRRRTAEPNHRNRPVGMAYIREIVNDKLPTAYLFPEAWREDPTRLSRLHGQAVHDMKLEPALSLHHARHNWAVTHLRAGMPVALVPAQLGHSTPVLTLKTYRAFIPQGDDRAHWRNIVEQDQKGRAIGQRPTFRGLLEALARAQYLTIAVHARVAKPVDAGDLKGHTAFPAEFCLVQESPFPSQAPLLDRPSSAE